ncbi:MAG: sulfotransferase domain-containing protein [Candidatus Marinimicrobia bacterium]|nr:sulfotransferase domain-containing protein [Candidatus Neomarinimicrobiota bacterium]MCF7829831.1 sulfotransferase domain-containing protein [Candidatus Neomarinimicrobiota bacterium]MCF7881736.1 sulfotransferase domain-containing protein [Candidatus Neomarinimicrobiota bacterium]MCF8232843.1 sulfotransferase domain-containing protein [Bacteroidales bacterium]
MDSQNPKVNLFVIGVNKAGSSWLYYLLNEHPDIFMSEVKELYYFGSEYPENLKKYHRNFDFSTEYKFYGEATPTYYRDEGTARNIHEYCPEAKILTIVRDPIQRLHSQFYYHKQLNLVAENKKVEEAVEVENHLISDSHYEKTLPVFEEIFGSEQVLLVSLEEAKADEKKVWEEVQRFLGLQIIQFPGERSRSENATGNRWFRLVYRLTIRPVKVYFPGLYKWLLQSQFMRWAKNSLLRVLGTARKEPISPETRMALEKEFEPTYNFLRERGLTASIARDKSLRPEEMNTA